MGDSANHPPVLLLVAAFSRYPEALDWGQRQAVEAWGPLALVSDPFEFVETDYYQATMGPGIKKQFWAFERLADPGELPAWKAQSNIWEATYAKLGQHQEPRPLNLDPGYLTLAKLVLASTKDHAHRIYLGHGMYAEITLNFRHRRWQHHDLTFPDYRRADYQAFFTRCRDYFHRREREGRA
ncbi:MAG: DUF4416 family protein [Pirellulales bacterium]